MHNLFISNFEQKKCYAFSCLLGLDETVSVTLVFPGNRMLTYLCSMVCELTQTAAIHGTKGTIQVHKMEITNMLNERNNIGHC